jgi:hypothetical protein
MSLAVQFSKVLLCFWDKTFSSRILVYAHTVIFCYLLQKEKEDSLVESCSWQCLSLWSFALISVPLLHNIPQQVNFAWVEIHQTQIQSQTPTCVRMTLPSLLVFFSTFDHWCYSEMNRNVVFINIKFYVQWVELFIHAPNVKLTFCLHFSSWISDKCHCVIQL